MSASRLLAWSPAALADAARGLAGSAEELRGLSRELDGLVVAVAGTSWDGVSARAAETAGAEAAGALAAAVAQVDLQARALAAAADALSSAQALLRQALDLAAAHALRVLEDGTVLPPPPVLHASDLPEAAKARIAADHARAAEAALSAQAMARAALAAADEADGDAAAALEAGDRVGLLLRGVGGGLLGLLGGGLGGPLLAALAASGLLGQSLVDAVGARGLPPRGASAREVAAWWASLPPAAQDVLLRARPEDLGGLDGLPVAARDRANRAVLAASLAGLDAEEARLREALCTTLTHTGRTALAAQLAQVEERRAMLRSVQEAVAVPGRTLLVLGTDLPGLAAVGIGDVEGADHVAVTVPGLTGWVTDYLPKQVANAARLQTASTAAAEALGTGTVATVAWIGYEAPGWTTVASDGAAERGAPALRETLRGLDARADASGRDVHLTLVGHSYGSLASGLAVQEPTGVDDLVLLGSPGVGADHVDELVVPRGHVHVGEAREDPVADLAHFGTDPSAEAFGAVPLQTDGGAHPLAPGTHRASTGHSAYYRDGSESLLNVAAVTAGRPDLTTRGDMSGAGDLLVLEWAR